MSPAPDVCACLAYLQMGETANDFAVCDRPRGHPGPHRADCLEPDGRSMWWSDLDPDATPDDIDVEQAWA